MIGRSWLRYSKLFELSHAIPMKCEQLVKVNSINLKSYLVCD